MLLPAGFVLRIAYRPLPAAYCPLPTACCLPPTAYYLLPAYCLLPTAYRLLPTGALFFTLSVLRLEAFDLCKLSAGFLLSPQLLVASSQLVMRL